MIRVIRYPAMTAKTGPLSCRVTTPASGRHSGSMGLKECTRMCRRLQVRLELDRTGPAHPDRLHQGHLLMAVLQARGAGGARAHGLQEGAGFTEYAQPVDRAGVAIRERRDQRVGAPVHHATVS